MQTFALTLAILCRTFARVLQCFRVLQAYETLSSAEAREAYDIQLQFALDDEGDGYTGAGDCRVLAHRHKRLRCSAAALATLHRACGV